MLIPPSDLISKISYIIVVSTFLSFSSTYCLYINLLNLILTYSFTLSTIVLLSLPLIFQFVQYFFKNIFSFLSQYDITSILLLELSVSSGSPTKKPVLISSTINTYKRLSVRLLLFLKGEHLLSTSMILTFLSIEKSLSPLRSASTFKYIFLFDLII